MERVPHRQSSTNGPANPPRPLALARRQDRPFTPIDKIDIRRSIGRRVERGLLPSYKPNNINCSTTVPPFPLVFEATAPYGPGPRPYRGEQNPAQYYPPWADLQQETQVPARTVKPPVAVNLRRFGFIDNDDVEEKNAAPPISPRSSLRAPPIPPRAPLNLLVRPMNLTRKWFSSITTTTNQSGRPG